MNHIESLKENLKKRNSWENRYERLKESKLNKQAWNYYKKIISATYSNQNLSEDEEAILYSQAFQRHLLKDPSSAVFGEFDEYEIEKTDNTYIISGYCTSTNSYGAKMREAYKLEVCKINEQWSCITDVGAKYLKWIIIVLILILLPSILAYCSLSSLY